MIPKSVTKKAKKDAKKASLASAVSNDEQLALDADARKLAAKVRHIFQTAVLHSHFSPLTDPLPSSYFDPAEASSPPSPYAAVASDA